MYLLLGVPLFNIIVYNSLGLMQSFLFKMLVIFIRMSYNYLNYIQWSEYGLLLQLLTGSDLNWEIIVSYIFAALITIFLSMPVHECAHGFIAYKLGDNTAKNMGRLSLNPFRHIDWIGSAMMILVGFGWANPVPVNMRNFRKPKVGMAIAALAGPVSNLLISLLMLLFGRGSLAVSGMLGQDTVAGVILLMIFLIACFVAELNIYLAVFNLIPIPPLDGSRILNAFLSDRAYYTLMRLERYTFIIVIGVVYIFGDYIDRFANIILMFMGRLVGLPFF